MALFPVYSPASPQARAIFNLSNEIFGICAVILALILFLVTYCLLRFRHKPGAPDPHQLTGNKTLEVAWTAIPFALVIFMFALTVVAMNRSDPTPRDGGTPDLVITGHQWWWQARYPKSGVVTANEIHIPAGRKWLVRLEAADVIHDFWVPQLSRKMDMVPGHPNHIWLQADEPGRYMGACAEYCGAQHAWMRFEVIADPPDQFQRWEEQQAQPARAGAAEQNGGRLFQQLTCGSCHAIKGTPFNAQVAPDLTHLATRKTLGAGVIENTPTNLARWLKDPQAIKNGCLMPNFHLSDARVAELVAYLEGLQ